MQKMERVEKTEVDLKLSRSSNMIALRTGSIMQQYMLFKFKKKIKIEGHGTYEVEITNLVNPNN